MNTSTSIPIQERLILIVEDSTQIRMIIAKALEAEGYKTKQGRNLSNKSREIQAVDVQDAKRIKQINSQVRRIKQTSDNDSQT